MPARLRSASAAQARIRSSIYLRFPVASAAVRDVEIPEDWEETSRGLDIALAPPSESIVFESPTGGTYCAVCVRLVALRSGLTLVGWDIATSWDDEIEPESFNSAGPIYTLGRQEYRRCEVLNQKIESNLPLRREQIAEGWILAQSSPDPTAI